MVSIRQHIYIYLEMSKVFLKSTCMGLIIGKRARSDFEDSNFAHTYEIHKRIQIHLNLWSVIVGKI